MQVLKVIVIFCLSVGSVIAASQAQASEPDPATGRMFECATYHAIAQSQYQRVYLFSGIVAYDIQNGKRAWSKWSQTPAGAKWMEQTKQTAIEHIKSWSDPEAGFKEEILNCDAELGILNSKMKLTEKAKEMGYIKEPDQK